MPVVTCPKCPTKLKVPDGAKGNVKCPKCGTSFPATAGAAAPAVEVVDEAPPKPAAPAAPASKPAAAAPKSPAKAEVADDDFEVIDEDDDDEPKKKKKKDEDDDEEAKAKAKKKKKKRDEDDAFDERPSGGGSGFGFAATGAKLIGISLWLYVGTFVYLALLLALAWGGVAIPNVLLAVAGLLGLGNWTLGLMGCAHCLAGPSRVRGPAATVLTLAIVHLLLSFSAGTRGTQPHSAIPLFSSLARAEDAKKLLEKLSKETDPAKRKEIEKELNSLGGGFDDERPGRGAISVDPFWHQIATQNPSADQLFGNLFYNSKSFSRYMLPLVSGLLELLRVVLLIALLGVIANAARDSGTAKSSLTSILLVLGATLASMIVMLIVAIVLDDSKSAAQAGTPTTAADLESAAKKKLSWFAGGEMLVYLLHAGGLVLAAIVAVGAKDAAARRA